MNQPTQINLLDSNLKSSSRVFNKDGTPNNTRIGLNKFASYNIYHILVGLSWWDFILFVFLLYLTINSAFATVFYFLPDNELSGIGSEMHFNHWWKMFFLSTQTITTVGYGQIPPVGFYANIICSIEALVGLLFFALITGLLYGRFSKPTATLFFSKNIIVTIRGSNITYNIRLANAKISELIEANAQLIIALDESVNGKKERNFYYVDLIVSDIAFLNSSWTITHLADKESPLYNLDYNDLKNKNVEFILLIKAIDDSYATEVHSRTSYVFSDVIWNAEFSPITQNEGGSVSTLIKKINNHQKF